MEKIIQALYKDGVLRPDEPLSLAEMQRVHVVIMDSLATDDDLAGYFAPELPAILVALVGGCWSW